MRRILRQGVDLILGIVVFGLLIWYIINPEKNFTSMLAIFAGYIVFNIINKIKIAKQIEDGSTKREG
jgi:hypothetical protein